MIDARAPVEPLRKKPPVGPLILVGARSRAHVILTLIEMDAITRWGLVTERLQTKAVAEGAPRMAGELTGGKPNGETRVLLRDAGRIHGPQGGPQVRLRTREVEDAVGPEAEAGEICAGGITAIRLVHLLHDLSDRIGVAGPHIATHGKLRRHDDEGGHGRGSTRGPQRAVPGERLADRQRGTFTVAVQEAQYRPCSDPRTGSSGNREQIGQRSGLYQIQVGPIDVQVPGDSGLRVNPTSKLGAGPRHHQAGRPPTVAADRRPDHCSGGPSVRRLASATRASARASASRMSLAACSSASRRSRSAAGRAAIRAAGVVARARSASA
jgi:hypothetical protein